ncbi:hypothetical protein [Gracilibacillus ureilyticus]|uniref:hypothetical protein n=1 Tax=Gracilibacillus ureilyticus TaxID=531814 RepID=UPI000B7C865F|nr:hypothetical protein [Gracilibacillus ureilyticus]
MTVKAWYNPQRIVAILLSLLGFGLGVGGIYQKRTNKKFTIWGLAIHGVFFILPNIDFVVMERNKALVINI